MRAQRLDRRERRPADAADVDRLHPERAQPLRHGAADPGAGLLRDDRDGTLSHEPADRGVEAGRAGLPFWLNGLLEVVEVQRDRVRADHVDERADVLRPERDAVVLRYELRDADVRDDERVRRALADDRVGPAEARVAQRRALAADAHPETVPRGRVGERRVHALRAGMAAGHPRDEQRERELVPEEPRRQIDLRGVGRGQRVVHQMDVVPAGGAPGLDVLFRGDAEVFGFPALDRCPGGRGPFGAGRAATRRRHRARVCAVRRARGRGSRRRCGRCRRRWSVRAVIGNSGWPTA